MQLDAYLTSVQKTTRERALREFGDQIGLSIHTIRKYCSGQRFPNKETVLEIERVTKGKVSRVDWYE